MKTILILSFVLTAFTTHAQLRKDRMIVEKILVVPRYADTTAANLQISIDSCGAIIYCYVDGHFYLRACTTPKYWIKILRNGDAGAGGTPGGSDTYVQFNDGGSFGGDAGMAYNKSTDVLSVNGGVFPITSGTGTLGSTSKQFNGLYLFEGTPINWDNGDATQFQQQDTMHFTGITNLRLPFGELRKNGTDFQFYNDASRSGNSTGMEFKTEGSAGSGTVAGAIKFFTGSLGMKIEDAGGGAATRLNVVYGGNNAYFETGNNMDIYPSAGQELRFGANGNKNLVTLNTAGKVGIGATSPTAWLHIQGGTSSANTSPIKLTNGTRNTTAEEGAIEMDNGLYFSKKNAVRMGLGGTLNSQYTNVGNVGGGEDDLMTYSIPAGTLSNDGDYLEFSMEIQFTGANTKTLRIYFGSQQLIGSNNSGTSVAFFSIKGTITRTGASAQRIDLSMVSSSATYAHLSEYNTATETTTGAITLKATGQATADNDIVMHMMTVKYFPVN